MEMINIQFKNFGLPSDYELEEDLRPYIDVNSSINSFVILRVNVFNEIEGLGEIKLSELTPESLRK